MSLSSAFWAGEELCDVWRSSKEGSLVKRRDDWLILKCLQNANGYLADVPGSQRVRAEILVWINRLEPYSDGQGLGKQDADDLSNASYRWIFEDIPPLIQEADKLRTLSLQRFDFTKMYEVLTPSLSQWAQKDIEEALGHFREDDYVSTIVKAYRVSEVVGRNLFRRLYGDDAVHKVRKHEDRLKRIWADEQPEKDKYPGIQVIASLFSIILWYRSKMGAHVELAPTMEAARISLLGLLQAIQELQRLGLLETFRIIPARGDVRPLAEAILEVSGDELPSKIAELSPASMKELTLALIEKFSLLDWHERNKQQRIKQTAKAIVKSCGTDDMVALIDLAVKRFATAAPDLIMEMLGEVGHLPPIVDLLREKGYMDWVISQFEASNSYDDAAKNAKVIAKIAPSLTDPETERILQAIATNGQIQGSRGAKGCLVGFVALRKSKVDPALSKKVEEIWSKA